MKLPTNLICLVLSLLSFQVACASSASANEHLPACAAECLTAEIPQSACELTNQTCICTNAPLQASLTECMWKSCTVKQILTTLNITATACNAPIRDRSSLLLPICITTASFAMACVVARIAYKYFNDVTDLGADDLFIFFAFLFKIADTFIQLQGNFKNGLGRDSWTLEFSQITACIQWYYAGEIFYFANLALVKMSMLFFFLRIFPGQTIRRIIWGTIIFNALVGITYVTTSIIQCRPINYAWNGWDGEHTGKCINFIAFGTSSASLSMALDVWIIALPLSQLVRLKIALSRKFAIALMFSMGFFVTVVSAVRLVSILSINPSLNGTWENAVPIIWSSLEIDAAIICTCMPTLRLIFIHLLACIMEGSRRPRRNSYTRQYSETTPKQGFVRRLSSKGHWPPMQGIMRTRSFEVTHEEADRNEDQKKWMGMEDWG